MNELKPRTDKILIFSLILMISVSFIIFIVINFFKSPENLNNALAIIVSLIILIFAVPPLILSITYFYSDLTKKVFLDETQKQIIIKKRGKKSNTIISTIEMEEYGEGEAMMSTGGRRFYIKGVLFLETVDFIS